MAFVRNNNNNNGRRHNNNYSNNRHRHQGPGNAGQNPNGQRRHVNRINQVFESNGPDGRVRGTAQQIVEKYTSMARDANVSGDRVLSLNYFQHAEHYQRLLNEITEENAAFEKEREATRQMQQPPQPETTSNGQPGDQPVENFAASEQPATEPREPRAPRPERIERPMRDDRPREDRPVREERAERPHRVQRERRPADDIDDNELPGFLQVPIKSGKPVEADSAVIVEAAPRARVPRPRKIAVSDAVDDSGDAE